MRQFIISLECPKRLSNERITELLGKMLDVALADAEDTLDLAYRNGEPEDDDAFDASRLIINSITPL